MWVKKSGFCALVLLACGALDAPAALIKSAKHASTSNHTVATTTSGQRSILMTVDPLNVASFQLDVTFEADKVAFSGFSGLNGYIIDFFQFSTDGSFGGVLNIHGYYPGFNTRPPSTGTLLTSASDQLDAPVPPPPAGEVDIFQLTFADMAPNLDKTFNVFASDNNDYIAAFNTDTGVTTYAQGPYNPAIDEGVDGANSTVVGVAAVPLPGGLAMGLIGGAGGGGDARSGGCTTVNPPLQKITTLSAGFPPPSVQHTTRKISYAVSNR